MIPESLKNYREKVAPFLRKELSLGNFYQIPALQKVVITTSVGSHSDRKQAVEDAVSDLTKITGQKPIINYAKRSVANFKLRAGEPLGSRVTLRGIRLWEFFDRFIFLVAPSIRDFRGFSRNSFDGRGNYALGIKDQSIFPEIDLDKVKRALGFDIIFVTSARTNKEGLLLLESLGVPFRKN